MVWRQGPWLQPTLKSNSSLNVFNVLEYDRSITILVVIGA